MTKIDFRDMTRALYRVVSAPPGQRDWQAVRHYYHPDARLVRTGLNPDGTPFARVMSFDAYVETVGGNESSSPQVLLSSASCAREARIEPVSSAA